MIASGAALSNRKRWQPSRAVSRPVRKMGMKANEWFAWVRPVRTCRIDSMQVRRPRWPRFDPSIQLNQTNDIFTKTP